MRRTEVYDIETLVNCFTYTGYCIQTKEWVQYVISDNINQLEELLLHLQTLNRQVGFNNEYFDYPLLHWIIENNEKLLAMGNFTCANQIYNRAQHLINDGEFNTIWDNKKYIPQTDLYLIHHYNNNARSASLKDIEFSLRMKNIQEMPFDHTHYVTSEEISQILEYNKNDVEATYQLLLITLGLTNHPVYKGEDKIKLRNKFWNLFSLKCDNYPDVKIGAELLLKKYCEQSHKDFKEAKKIRGSHEIVALKECVPRWCKIETKEFKNFLDTINKTIVKGDAKEFQYSVIFHGIQFDFGLGGSHGCIKPGVYKSSNERVIMDLDVGSLYPSIIISLGLYPRTLGPEFLPTYIQLRDARLAEKHKKEGRDNSLIKGYKLALNGIKMNKFNNCGVYII